MLSNKETVMKCPNCHQENEADSLFCTNCGAPLSGKAVTEGTGPQAPNTLEEQVQALHEEVRSIREQHGQTLGHIQNRLASLERTQGAPVPQPSSALQQPLSAESAGPGPVTIHAKPPIEPAYDDLLTKIKEWNWEQVLGGNWLARVGVLAIIIGTAFFLKLAFDNDWIGPTGRVALGVIGGMALLGSGEYWQRKYPVFAQTLSGGGIAILYLSLFAAHSTFGLIGVYVATGILLLISVTSAAIAVRYESLALAIISIFGAFLTPFILGAFSPKLGNFLVRTDSGIDMLAYIIVVDIGVLALSTFRNWRWMTILAWVGSLASYGGWYGQFGSDAGVLTAQLSLTLIFLTFVGATTLYHIIWRRAPKRSDQALMTANSLSYFSISLGIMSGDFDLWMGAFSLAIALFYGGLAYLALRRSANNAPLSFFALGIAMVFLTVAVPIQLGDSAWTTIVWSAQGAVLTWVAFQVRMPRVRIFGYAAFGLVAIRLILFDTRVDLSTYHIIWNERMLSFVLSIAAMYVTAYLSWRYRKALTEWEESVVSVFLVFLAAASFFTLWVLGAEIISGFDKQLGGLTNSEWSRGVGDDLRNAKNLSITTLLALYAAVLLTVGIIGKWRVVRFAAIALLLIPIAKVFAYDIFILGGIYRIVSLMGLGAMLMIGGYVYQRYGKAIMGVSREK
jgi:uncharacterized membrane protein